MDHRNYVGIGQGLLGIALTLPLLVGCGLSCSGRNTAVPVVPPHADAADPGDVSPPSDEIGDTAATADGPSGTSPKAGVTAIAAGGGHACALASTGVWCWGRNQAGELGHGGPGTLTPALVPLPETPTAIAAGGSGGDTGHTCAVTVAGRLYCWGFNLDGQLGDGTLVSRPEPKPVAGLEQVTGVGAGAHHTCALKKDGTVWCWGMGRGAALGSGGLGDQLTPGQVKGGADAQSLAVGFDHNCLRRSDNAVLCWGSNHFGEVGTGDQIAVLAATTVKGLEATAVAAGNMVSCAVRPDRTATCWGTNQYGQIGDGKGDRGVMALTPAPVKDLSDVSTIAVGGGSVCAVSTTKQLLCWGSNFTGQVPGSPQDTTLTPFAVRSVIGATVSALGSGVCLALLADGSVWGWGNGEAVQIQGAGSDSVAAPHLIPGLSP